MDKGKLAPYEHNRGKTCLTSGCGHKARIKGLCVNCYSAQYKKNKTATISL
jgi:hypothetical protein